MPKFLTEPFKSDQAFFQHVQSTVNSQLRAVCESLGTVFIIDFEMDLTGGLRNWVDVVCFYDRK